MKRDREKLCLNSSNGNDYCNDSIHQAFNDRALGCTQVYEWHARFKTGRKSIERELLGRPVTSRTPENFNKIRDCKDCRMTID